MNQEALKAALEAIRRRDRFESEIRSLLQSKGFEPEDVLEYLKGRRFLDDVRVAQTECERLRRKGLGPERIRIDLLHRGAPEDLVSSVLDDQPGNQAAKDALAKKFPSGGDRVRMMRFLLSRGFSEEDAEAAVGEQ